MPKRKLAGRGGSIDESRRSGRVDQCNRAVEIDLGDAGGKAQAERLAGDSRRFEQEPGLGVERSELGRQRGSHCGRQLEPALEPLSFAVARAAYRRRTGELLE